MNKVKKIPRPKGRSFNGRPYPKIRRIREEPSQKIRQLLQSFVPMERPKSGEVNRQKDRS